MVPGGHLNNQGSITPHMYFLGTQLALGYPLPAVLILAVRCLYAHLHPMARSCSRALAKEWKRLCVFHADMGVGDHAYCNLLRFFKTPKGTQKRRAPPFLLRASPTLLVAPLLFLSFPFSPTQLRSPALCISIAWRATDCCRDVCYCNDYEVSVMVQGAASHALWHAWAMLEATQGENKAVRYLFARGLESNPRSRYIFLSWALWEKQQGQVAMAKDLLMRGATLNRRDPAILQVRITATPLPFALFGQFCVLFLPRSVIRHVIFEISAMLR